MLRDGTPAARGLGDHNGGQHMIGIIGAGAFGTALGVAQARHGRPVVMLARDAAQAAKMGQTRQSARLAGVTLPDMMHITADPGDLRACQTVLLCVPMQALRGVLQRHAADLEGKRLVACCKGIDLQTLTGPTAVIAEICPEAHAMVLTGPSFATDIAAGLSTALTLAGGNADAVAQAQDDIALPTLRLYRSADPVGAELGGALKNVIAIASGAVIGAGLGESARAAVMTRGFAEMSRLAVALGAAPSTLMGLSGFGDLVLTCASVQSRNYRFGLALGRAEGFASDITVEGVATAHAVARLAVLRGVEMPITTMLVALLEGRITLPQAIAALLTRPLRDE